MLRDITIGQYIDTGSVLHKLDPRIKLFLTTAYVIVLFIINNPVSYLIFGGFTFVLILLSKIPVKFILKGLKPMLFILLFTVVLNLFMIRGTPLVSVPVFNWFTLTVTY